MSGTVLVTGGTGKTGRRVVSRLRARGIDARVGSRKEPASFDWADATTHEAALRDVGAIYLVAPTGALDALQAMRPFLERALASGVRRYVLLSASSLEEGGPLMGAVHAWLKAETPEWVALRPTWFMQNFSEQHHRDTIREERVIESAAGDGRVGFIDAENIAEVAVEALVRPDFASRELVITGPETLSYDDVAATIAQALGETVRHRRLTEAELAARHTRTGMPEVYAKMLAAMDTSIAGGSEDRVTPGVLEATGHGPGSFRQFVSGAVAAWR